MKVIASKAQIISLYRSQSAVAGHRGLHPPTRPNDGELRHSEEAARGIVRDTSNNAPKHDRLGRKRQGQGSHQHRESHRECRHSK